MKDKNTNTTNNEAELTMTKAERKREIAKAVMKFKGEMSAAGDALTRAAKIYADTIAKFGDSAGEAFRKEYPAVTSVTWNKLLQLAAGKIVPEMIMVSDRVYKKYVKEPVEKQRKMFGGKKTVRVVTSSMKVAEIKLRHLTDTDVEQVFKDDGSMRTIDEQIEIVKNRKVVSKTADYEVCGNVLIVHRATRIGKCELVKILEQMK